MKDFLYMILAGVFFALVVNSCKQAKKDDCHQIYLGKQKIVITSVIHTKYSTINFKYDLPLPNNEKVALYGSNAASGYYYKQYSIQNGDTLIEDVYLIENGCGVYVQDINFSKYER